MRTVAARPPRVNTGHVGIVVFLGALALSCREDDLSTGPSAPRRHGPVLRVVGSNVRPRRWAG